MIYGVTSYVVDNDENHTVLMTLPTNVGPTYRDYPEYKAAKVINNGVLPVLCAIGFFFNTAAFITIWKLKPITSSSIYVACLSVADTLALILKVLYLYLSLNHVHIGGFGCGFLFMSGSFCIQFANWLVVLMTVERFVAIWMPLKVSDLFTKLKTKLSILTCAIVLLLLNSHYLWTTTQHYYPATSKYKCGPGTGYEYFINNVWYRIRACLYAIIPCISLFCLNSLIIYGLRVSFKERRRLASSSAQNIGSSDQRRHEKQLTTMLVLVSIVFVCLTTPVMIHVLIENYIPQSTPQDQASFILVREILHTIANTNHAMNFLLYFLSSRKFRKMFIRLITCKRRLLRPGGMYTSQSRSHPARSSVTTTLTTRVDRND